MREDLLWTTEGLLVDKNGDGAPDGVSLYIDLPDGLMPFGLLDFVARAGLETAALSHHFFEKRDQQWTMAFLASEETKLLMEAGELKLLYRSEAELSELLSQLAASGEQPASKATAADVRSLADIWSGSGFGEAEEASPERQLSLSINMPERMENSGLFKELCHFAARCGLYSTGLQLPVWNNPHAHVQLSLVEEQDTFLHLPEDNHIELHGSADGCAALLKGLNGQRHWSDGGAFGYWEQEAKRSDANEASEWFHVEWEDRSEVERTEDELEALKHRSLDRVEIFLSEPLEIRRRLQEKWRQRFPDWNEISVRSAFKPGFHWIREELLSEIPEETEEIRIAVRKDAYENGMELPIRWIQELYPIDALIEKEKGIPKERVVFSLHDELPHTYEIEALLADGSVRKIGAMEVPVAKIPYLHSPNFVYPATGAIRLYTDDESVEETLMQPDRERFYEFYMQQFLPELKDKLAGWAPGQGHDRPFFDRMEIRVTMSEEEEKLGIDEERTSSMEALYEEVYFNTLDVFADWGLETEGKAFNAPGGIHPYMEVKRGAAPQAQIRLYRWDDQPAPSLKTVRLHFERERFTEATMLKDGELVRVETDGQPDVPEKGGRGRTVMAGYSFQGRPIPVIEHFLPSGESFDSALKMTLFKRTVVFEAGHHANEISSTPAVERLGETVQDYLKDVNIVVIPLANPDGTALLEKMTAVHPEWKHHAARYNAVGLEFAHARYSNTVFGEADVLPHLMKKWAPDVIIDNHGIPAHEWVQPFAGYNSPPRFPVSYFLPSAKLYGIAHLPEGHGGVHAENLETIVSSISGGVEGTVIAEENRYWKERFRKYGNDWLPEVFPIEEGGHLHFYRHLSVTPEHSTVSVLRYPEWVAADIISEAADEVVQGQTLERCIQGQMLFNEGVLGAVSKQPIRLEDNGLSKKRHRPLRIK